MGQIRISEQKILFSIDTFLALYFVDADRVLTL